jgi:hypothetical protein
MIRKILKPNWIFVSVIFFNESRNVTRIQRIWQYFTFCPTSLAMVDPMTLALNRFAVPYVVKRLVAHVADHSGVKLTGWQGTVRQQSQV